MRIYIISIISIIILNVIIISLVIRWYRNNILRQYNNFLNKADEILSGKPIDIMYDESIDSAISERLNRIVEISRMQKEVAEEERDIIKSLLSNISHQIRTPLTNITLYAGLLKDEVKESSAFRLADKIEKNAEKLEFFMKELLKSSYAEQEIISVKPKIVELDKVMKKSCQSVELDAMKKNIHVSSEYTNYKVFADLKWTEEVFTNIIENAIKYSPNGTEIIIKSILYESFVCVQIIDNGIGIPEQEQGKIFQRFYQGSNVTDKQGFGIGLYLAREVLRKQQGYMKIKSGLNNGTTVEVFLSRRAF
ncbi:HAMP domain-containing sensor histidine kinase [Blautia pseudococcoides]|uniref:sensor histidine kinase n=1 Tax=Blautia pseudococcoides TaxID=1796616 RepID=UPI00148B152B|nr:HAMP domain-containing sensor histidine kinase [Blautia pseudococcoides]QJU14295.1 HAMP domain-containing histidine kinase [Blautia pseudococcoides]